MFFFYTKLLFKMSVKSNIAISKRQFQMIVGMLITSLNWKRSVSLGDLLEHDFSGNIALIDDI